MQTEKEIWRPVPSEPGVLASSWGRVLLPPRYAAMPNGGYRFYETKPRLGAVMSNPKVPSDKYRNVTIYDQRDGKRQRTRTVHRLICEAFHGPAPFPGAVAMHLDENPLNNRSANLNWGTQRENMNASGLKQYHRSRTGENSAWAIHRATRQEMENV